MSMMPGVPHRATQAPLAAKMRSDNKNKTVLRNDRLYKCGLTRS